MPLLRQLAWRSRGAGRRFSSARPGGPQLAASALHSARAGNWVRFQADDGGIHWGVLSAARCEGEAASRHAMVHGSEMEIMRLLPPVLVDPPPAVLCLGLNYRAHAEETKQELPRFPVVFYKNPASVTATLTDVVIPDVARSAPEVDLEAELAVVLGADLKDAKQEEEILSSIWGITAANDVSARRWQGKKGGGQWSYAKSFDGFCPLGPSLMPSGSFASACSPAGSGLRLRSFVNGQIMQDACTSDMIFNLFEVIKFLSAGTTLLKGTVILTGTPAGVGFTRTPPVYIKPGDEVVVELEGMGSLRNKFV